MIRAAISEQRLPPRQGFQRDFNPRFREGWAARYVPLLLGRPGVITPERHAKHAPRTLAALRAGYFNPRPTQTER